MLPIPSIILSTVLSYILIVVVDVVTAIYTLVLKTFQARLFSRSPFVAILFFFLLVLLLIPRWGCGIFLFLPSSLCIFFILPCQLSSSAPVCRGFLQQELHP